MADADVDEVLAEQEPPNQPARKAPPKAGKPLPTTRISLAKQFDLLRAYGASFVSTNRPVKVPEVGVLVNMHPDTVRLANGFFVDVGFLAKAEAGFVPHADVISFHRAREFSAADAEHRLQPLLRETWFAQAIATRLAFRGTLDESEVITLLADAANATPDHRAQLSLLLAFLETAGIVTRDGTMVRATLRGPSIPSTAQLSAPSVQQQQPIPAPPPEPNQSKAMRKLDLPGCGGTLALSGDFNPFELEGAERKLVYDIIDMMNKFERGELTPKANDDQKGGN